MFEPVTVLIADDSAVARLTLTRAMEQEGGLSVVAACADGTEALAALAEHRPEAAVLDQFMPGATGLEVAAAARAEGLTTAIAIVSAGLDGVDVAALREAGITAWFEKGALSARGLMEAVRALALDRRRPDPQATSS